MRRARHHEHDAPEPIAVRWVFTEWIRHELERYLARRERIERQRQERTP